MRPREFDRDVALEQAIHVFWSKGFASTSTEDLLEAMGIGRQSLYNAFGDKRQLYLEALRAYQRRTTRGHVARLTAPASPLAGIRDLLLGIAPDDDEVRCRGCMGIGAIGEFGVTDPELLEIRDKESAVLHDRLVARIREGQKKGEIDTSISAVTAAGYVTMAMSGLGVMARAGTDVAELHKLARFTVNCIRAK